ncbi:MAG: hypothetical protein AAFO15_00975, partial [Pseudomonadota bacterium]
NNEDKREDGQKEIPIEDGSHKSTSDDKMGEFIISDKIKQEMPIKWGFHKGMSYDKSGGLEEIIYYHNQQDSLYQSINMKRSSEQDLLWEKVQIQQIFKFQEDLRVTLEWCFQRLEKKDIACEYKFIGETKIMLSNDEEVKDNTKIKEIADQLNIPFICKQKSTREVVVCQNTINIAEGEVEQGSIIEPTLKLNLVAEGNKVIDITRIQYSFGGDSDFELNMDMDGACEILDDDNLEENINGDTNNDRSSNENINRDTNNDSPSNENKPSNENRYDTDSSDSDTDDNMRGDNANNNDIVVTDSDTSSDWW